MVSKVTVTKAYTAQYSNPIRFDAGESVTVGREDDTFPGWYWCRDGRGREGWVPARLLDDTQGPTTGRRTYSAQELTVAGGEGGELIQRFGGWVEARLDDGRVGWLPETHVRVDDR